MNTPDQICHKVCEGCSFGANLVAAADRTNARRIAGTHAVRDTVIQANERFAAEQAAKAEGLSPNAQAALKSVATELASALDSVANGYGQNLPLKQVVCATGPKSFDRCGAEIVNVPQ